MKKVVYISNFSPIPPIKGAAVQTWINEVAKRLMFFEPHTISIDDEFLPLKEYKDGVFHHRIHISRVYERIFQKILGHRKIPLAHGSWHTVSVGQSF